MRIKADNFFARHHMFGCQHVLPPIQSEINLQIKNLSPCYSIYAPGRTHRNRARIGGISLGDWYLLDGEPGLVRPRPLSVGFLPGDRGTLLEIT